MKSVSHIILATLLSTGTAIAQETIDFDHHDTNNDGFLTDQEWSDVNAGVVAFDDVDADGDGKLSKAEVTAASAVDAESSPEPGADLETTEVTAEDHSMAQSGQIDRNADEEDPTLSGAASNVGDQAPIVAMDDTEAERDARDTADEQSATAISSQDNKADSATDDERRAASDPQMQEAGDEQAGFVTAEESERATDTEPQGGLAAQTGDVVTEDNQDASVAQPDVEMQNIDTATTRDSESMAANVDGDEQSQQQAAAQGSDQRQGGMQQAGSDQQGKQAFRDADRDGDNRLSESEVKDAGYDYVVMYFEPLDINRDSYLDESEWDQGAGQQAAPGMRDQQEASLYLNGDGPQDTRFERSEYEGDDGAVRFEEDFETYDINDDGYLDESEAVETDWVDVNLFEYSDVNDDGLIDIGEANDGFMEWGDDAEDEVVTGEDY